MKKKFVVFLMMCGLCTAAFAQQKYLGCIFSGEYAYFLDNRYENPCARGYLVLHSSEDVSLIFAVTADLSTGRRWETTFSTGLTEDGTITLLGIRGIDGLPEGEHQFVLQTTLDFLNYAAMRKVSEERITESCVLEDKWTDDYSLWYHFSSAVPFFGITRITDSKDASEPILEACRFGVVESFTDEAISGFLKQEIIPFVETPRNSGSVPPKAKKMSVKLGGYSVALDENWTKHTYSGMDSYWLGINSVREAQIMVEPIPDGVPFATNSDKLVLARLLLLYGNDFVPGSISAKFERKNLVLEYDGYDEQGWVTSFRITITDGSMVNFSAYKDVLQANEKYFQSIFKSIRK